MLSLTLTLILSLGVLLVSADLVIRGSIALALKMRVPPLAIGLTVVAFGTSAPELVVSAQAVINNLPGIALGNVVGSNIANVLLVLGLPAMFYPITADQPTIRRNTLFMIGITALFVWWCNQGTLVFWQGVVFVALGLAFVAYAGLSVSNGRKGDPLIDEFAEIDGMGGMPKSRGMIAVSLIIGLAGLPAASYFLIESAQEVARLVGVPDSVIALSLIAFGTSLPELATAIAAAVHRHSAVALGNIIGSNFFNISAVMGISAMIADIPVPTIFLSVDLWIMTAASLAIVPFAFTRSQVGRIWGFLFFASYVFFILANFTLTRAP